MKRYSYLKIKDDVDMKVLETFGFKHDTGFYFDMFTGEKKQKTPCYKSEKPALWLDLTIREEDREICFVSTSNSSLLLLYDLITAGLVEKVI